MCVLFLTFLHAEKVLSPTPFDVIGLDSMQSPHRPAKWSQTISASAVIKLYSESVSYDSEVTQEFTQNVCSPPLSSVCNMQTTIDSAACWQSRECKCVLNCCHSHIITRDQVKRIFQILDARGCWKIESATSGLQSDTKGSAIGRSSLA